MGTSFDEHHQQQLVTRQYRSSPNYRNLVCKHLSSQHYTGTTLVISVSWKGANLFVTFLIQKPLERDQVRIGIAKSVLCSMSSSVDYDSYETKELVVLWLFSTVINVVHKRDTLLLRVVSCIPHDPHHFSAHTECTKRQRCHPGGLKIEKHRPLDFAESSHNVCHYIRIDP